MARSFVLIVCGHRNCSAVETNGVSNFGATAARSISGRHGANIGSNDPPECMGVCSEFDPYASRKSFVLRLSGRAPVLPLSSVRRNRWWRAMSCSPVLSSSSLNSPCCVPLRCTVSVCDVRQYGRRKSNVNPRNIRWTSNGAPCLWLSCCRAIDLKYSLDFSELFFGRI